MGTNYYGMKIPTEKDKEEIKKAIDKDNWGMADEMMPNRIHLGKASAGWQFCFDHNYWEYFEKDYNEIKDFINSCSIIDEYGINITCDEFWDKVESKKEDGLVSADDIFVGGLRFASYSDFS